jgi:type IV pilus assembly protein PilB
MSNLRIDEKRLSQDCRFKSKISDKEIDFRVSTFPTQFGEKIQLSLLDSTSVINDLPELGLFGKNLDLIKEGIKKPYGLILLTGPTGAGKTTTLYSILNILNNETVNILTLEDPVEYYLEGVNQSQVRPEIGYTFATGLRSLVRQDPNIIMVGEIRDKETASLAINAALTGHIVISTLHTNNAVGVIPRILEMGIEEYLLPTILNFVIAQRLIRKLCQSCKKSVKINDRAKEIINKGLEGVEEFTPELKLTENSVLYQAVGCSKCNQTGTSGRIGIYEVFIMTRELEEVILKRPTEVELKKQSEKQKMLTMKQSGIIQALKGLVSLEEVLRIIND